MTTGFISEPLEPDHSFDPATMAGGEPGLPTKFRWGSRELTVSGIVEKWKDYGDCKHGSGERYVRRHVWRIRTADGLLARIYFQRSFGKSRAGARWWLHSIEA